MHVEAEVREEIERLHRFFSRWFRGEIDAESIEVGLVDALVDSFVNIQPAGRVLTRAELLEGIRRGHGSNPDFEIEIRDVVVRRSSHGFIVATYLEVQRGAKNTTPSDNARRSTVVFERIAGFLRWVHVHETAVPMKDMDETQPSEKS